MTDKNDIEALLGEVPAISNLFEAGKFIAKVLDQLEAEHQRADKAESYARERDSENESIALTVGRLRLELADLRGEQEPDGYIFCHPTGKLFWSIVSETCAGDDGVRPYYFTRQHKPVVVLPAYKFCPSEYQGSLLWSETEMWNKAITAAKSAMETVGIVVKDGE